MNKIIIISPDDDGLATLIEMAKHKRDAPVLVIVSDHHTTLQPSLLAQIRDSVAQGEIEDLFKTVEPSIFSPDIAIRDKVPTLYDVMAAIVAMPPVKTSHPSIPTWRQAAHITGPHIARRNGSRPAFSSAKARSRNHLAPGRK